MAVAPDLVFLDVRMPRMDGYELARRLRESAPKGSDLAAQGDLYLLSQDLGKALKGVRSVDELQAGGGRRRHAAADAEVCSSYRDLRPPDEGGVTNESLCRRFRVRHGLEPVAKAAEQGNRARELAVAHLQRLQVDVGDTLARGNDDDAPPIGREGKPDALLP